EDARTAVLCASDIFALELLNQFRGRGLRVPRDVGLAGFDSIDALRFISPRITTVEYPIQRMGELAFALLAEGPKGGADLPQIELEPEILWGESV
ncbi:MAG TPA: substrate-binding domain-containing protein, partial [Rectinemataceae bacterium]|nr:substrate-binding domain-containing protein [Rectinemataceae bacterium]